MSASGDDDNERECTAFDSDTECDVVVGFQIGIAVLSMISCVYIVFVIIALKRHKFVQQRLIVYLNIAIFFYLIHYVWADHHIANDARNGGDLVGFCKFQGWYQILTAWITFIWVCIITFNIALLTVFTKRLESVKLDIVFWAVAVIPAIIISVIPFTVDAYGPAGIWCWISSKKDDEDFAAGVAMQFALFYGPWIFLCTVMAAVLIVVYAYMKYRLWKTGMNKDHGDPEMQEELWKEQIRPFMPFPAIFIATFIFPVINRLRLAAGYDDPHSALNFTFWFLHAASLPLTGFLFALVITLNRETLSGLKGVMTKCCKKNKREGMLTNEADYGSVTVNIF